MARFDSFETEETETKMKAFDTRQDYGFIQL